MTFNVSLLVTIVGLFSTMLALTLPTVPEQYKHWGAFAWAILEAVKGLLNHYSNPDGTPVRIAYRGKVDKANIPGTFVSLILLLLCAGVAPAQTTSIPPDVIRTPATVNGLVWVVVPGLNKMVPVEMEGLQLVNVGGVFKLQVIPTSAAAQTPKVATFKPSAAQAEYDLLETPTLGSLHVYRNGLLMSETDDYVHGGVEGRHITFTAGQVPQAGDLIQFRYSVPAP